MSEMVMSVKMSMEEYQRMKNCANCDHNEVCLVVAQRKAKHANDYSPCSKWKLVEKQ